MRLKIVLDTKPAAAAHCKLVCSGLTLWSTGYVGRLGTTGDYEANFWVAGMRCIGVGTSLTAEKLEPNSADAIHSHLANIALTDILATPRSLQSDRIASNATASTSARSKVSTSVTATSVPRNDSRCFWEGGHGQTSEGMQPPLLQMSSAF